MSKLIVFNSISVDGYFTDTKGDVTWAHQNDPEWQQFTNENVSGGGILLFGRVTYDMMQSYWPTPQARKQFPRVADRMNSAQKVVVSRTLNKVSWQNTRLIKGNLPQEVRKLKAGAGEGIVILGSGTIVSQLAQENLIDQYQLVVNPVVLGAGRTLFEGVNNQPRLKRVQSRTFKNGNVLLTYEPA
ncbi:MAG TPA: dihydrofolate reductase family protein [Gemmatimonadaceae bacterium]|nr:dihydrofolate reductase family protein [Gemmatimonadaceae bacterium]